VPESMTPKDRRREVAEILAAAVVRLRLRAAPSGGPSGNEKTPEPGPNCLEVPAETRLSVPTGLRPAPARETEGRTCN
jgi:hypothetical protein